MNYSYKRYWEPSTAQSVSLSLALGTVASVLTYPLEFIKTRIQVRTEGVGLRNINHEMGVNPFKIFREIHESGRGVSGVYQGLDSYLASRLTYLFVRNLTYKIIYDHQKPFKPTNDLSHREKAVIAGFAGALGALVSNPFELVNTRIIADGAIYKPNRRNYKGFADALESIRSKGSYKIFQGGWANVLRAVVLNISLTGPYDYLKEKCWITFGDADTFNHQIALLWASCISTLFVLPFDNIRVRLMIQNCDPTKNRVGYKGFTDAVLKILRNEGFTGFHTGYFTAVARIWAYSQVTVFFSDEITTGWKKSAGLKEWEI